MQEKAQQISTHIFVLKKKTKQRKKAQTRRGEPSIYIYQTSTQTQPDNKVRKRTITTEPAQQKTKQKTIATKKQHTQVHSKTKTKGKTEQKRRKQSKKQI